MGFRAVSVLHDCAPSPRAPGRRDASGTQCGRRASPLRTCLARTMLPLLLAAVSAPGSAWAATVAGTLVGGGGVDDMRIVVRPASGQDVEAYCGDRCGDWFEAESEQTDVIVLKKAMIGRRVVVEYATEANGQRIAGPGPDDRLPFVKKVRLLP